MDGLVAAGLVLICWRLLAGRSAAWLINANALAAAIVLVAASVVDLGAVSATWNVRHARELGGGGAPIDLCYLGGLGPSAALPLITLEQTTHSPALRDRSAAVRADTMRDLVAWQGDRHSWTWRNARRLAAAQTRLGSHPALPSPAPNGRACDGSKLPPPAPEPAPSNDEALTGAPQR